MVLSKFLEVNSLTAGPTGLEYVGAGRGAGLGVSFDLLAVGLGPGNGGGASFLLLPNPIDKIDRVAPGGGSLFGGCVGTFSSLGVLSIAGFSGILEFGRGGILGAISRSTLGGCRKGRIGADFVETRGILAA